MTRRKHTLALLLLLVGGGYWIARLSVDYSSQVQRSLDLEKENLELRSALHKRQQAARETPSDDGLLSSDRDERSHQPEISTKPRAFDDKQVIISLRTSLAAQERAAADKDSRIADLGREIIVLRELTRRQTDDQSRGAEQVASFRRQLENVEAALKSRQDQLSQAQKESQLLSDQLNEARQKLSRADKAIAELHEIQRRRETYLNSLFSRYRDVNRQYRDFAMALDKGGRSEGTLGSLGGPELTRIQSTISLAEEDMRQLNHLNARAQQIQKELKGK